MRKYNATTTPLETREKLKKETYDEFVSAIIYKQIIGSLRYIFNIRPDICQSVRLLRRFMEKPQECHLTTVKRVLRYIKFMIGHGVLMPIRKKTNPDTEVCGYTDSDFSGYQDKKKSTGDYIFMMEGASISWSSRKQSIMDLLSCEVEYVVALYAA